MKSELGSLSGNLNDKLRGDIESNKVKLVADGDNSAVKVRHVQSTQAALGCLPGEQQINDYCGEYLSLCRWFVLLGCLAGVSSECI